MNPKNAQLLLVFTLIIITAALFFGGKTKAPVKDDFGHATNTVVNNDSLFLKRVSNKINMLSSFQQDTLKQLSSNIENAKSKLQKKQAYLAMSEYWLNLGEPDCSTFYEYLAAKTTNETNDLIAANKRMELAATLSPDSIAKVFFTEKAIQGYSSLTQSMPDSLQFAISQAQLLIEEKQEVMQGVMILRSVIEKDSLNLHANLILGRLSVISGQHDKAVNRLLTVLKQEPENTEALYFLGEAYVGLGQIAEAVKVFEKCKTLVDNPAFIAEIDKYILKITKQ